MISMEKQYKYKKQKDKIPVNSILSFNLYEVIVFILHIHASYIPYHPKLLSPHKHEKYDLRLFQTG